MKFHICIIILLCAFKASNSVAQICDDTNCPKKHGYCSNNTCKCLGNYVTFSQNPNKGFMYCNYEKISRWIPLLCEILVPSLGHFYIGKFTLAFIKLGLLLFPIIVLLLGFYCGPKTVQDNSSDFELEQKEQKTSFFGVPLCLSILSLIGFLIMVVTDIIFFSTAWYLDGNGINLA